MSLSNEHGVMQPLAPDVLGISKTPWVFGQLVNSRRFFLNRKIYFFYIHGNLGKHLKPFDHALAEPWLGLGCIAITKYSKF